jgi:hypothetical protein
MGKNSKFACVWHAGLGPIGLVHLLYGRHFPEERSQVKGLLLLERQCDFPACNPNLKQSFREVDTTQIRLKMINEWNKRAENLGHYG